MTTSNSLPDEPEALWALLADVLQALEDAGEDPRLEGFSGTDRAFLPGIRRTPESGKWYQQVTWNADGDCRWTYTGGE